MSFSTPNRPLTIFAASSFALHASDTHKAREAMHTFAAALAAELLRVYADDRHVQHASTLDMHDFSAWASDKDETTAYLARVALPLAVSAVILHRGIRRNNSGMIRAARTATRLAFHARGHRFYRLIVEHDEMQRLRLPELVRRQFDAMPSFASRRQVDDEHQGTPV